MRDLLQLIQSFFKEFDNHSWYFSDQIEYVVALKEKKPDLKVLVSIGGYNQGSAHFSQMAASGTKRVNFISTTLAAIQKYGFDGLDLVWEYPGNSAGSSSDKVNKVLLIFHILFNNF